MLDKRLNDKGKNWRHVLKSLKVLDYCLHEGSELVVTWARKNNYIIKTLREFQYVDEEGHDVGQNGVYHFLISQTLTDQPLVRVSAKELTSLIMDEERLRTERSDRKTWKSRVTGIDEFGPQGSGYPAAGEPSNAQRRRPERRPQRPDEEDLEYKLAIEASRNEAEEDEKRRKSQIAPSDEEDLAKAIQLSKEEAELRRKELEESNASLIDDSPTPNTQPQNTGYNQGYQQQGAVDWFGNPVDQQPQQAQTTGYLNNVYSQPGTFQNQPTGFQNGFQQRQAAFTPSQFQQQQPNYIQAQPPIQPQQTSFNVSNPYAQQTPNYNAYQQQQQIQSPMASPVAGTHNPWALSQQQQLDPLKPAPTGSNNPFASSFNRPQVQQQQSSPPNLSSLAEQRTATQSSNQSSFNPMMNYSIPQPNPISNYASPEPNPIANYANPQAQRQPPPPQKAMDSHTARLNAMLASGEGMDTFGNTGETRIPAQHTAPGTFVNSAGQGLSKLHATQTGNNPFFSQQTTGTHGYGVQRPQLMPAQTGPAGMNGFVGTSFSQINNNPFGTQQSHQQQAPGGSLIDL